MGACNFETQAEGETAADAYNAAVRDAQFECGHNDYNGTISTTGGFKMFRTTIGPPTDVELEKGWNTSEKWGQCWCVERESGKFTFWGWAAE
jgi:hypothetical protein